MKKVIIVCDMILLEMEYGFVGLVGGRYFMIWFYGMLMSRWVVYYKNWKLVLWR